MRYYDKVGLLSPSARTEAGYRLYTDNDLLSLQQILALKFLGFSLEEIKAYLRAGPQRLQETLAQQKAMLHERRSQLDTIIQAISEAERLLQTEQYTWRALVKVIQAIQMGQNNNKEWVQKYFTDEQLKIMQELHQQAFTPQAEQRLKELHPGTWTEADQQRVNEQYAFVKTELTRLVAAGADPASPAAQKVAQIRDELLSGFAQGDPEITASLQRWWQRFEALPPEQRPFDITLYTYSERENEFLEQALAIYKQQDASARS